MQKQPVQDLTDEHGGIIVMLDIMKKVAIRLKDREDVIGEGKHEEYHGWLKDLKEIYII